MQISFQFSEEMLLKHIQEEKKSLYKILDYWF